jgi:NAD(P)H-flavin reductase
MHYGQGQLIETSLGLGARIICAPELIPAPGQYLLAHTGASDAPLPVPLFFSGSTPNGFRAAPPLPAAWTPGTRLYLRGPLGRGFQFPDSARRVALVAYDGSSARLLGLIPAALKQGAAVTLVTDVGEENLSEEVEVQPLRSLSEVYEWCDYAAMDVARENLVGLRVLLHGVEQSAPQCQAQILIRAPMPCGALAECGACAASLKHGWVMICRDGPVLDLTALK